MEHDKPAADEAQLDLLVDEIFGTRTGFYKRRAVRVLGECGDGSMACIEYANPEDGEHEHVPADEVTDERYPEVEVELSGGQDGNTMMIVGKVRVALRRAGFPQVVDEFTRDVASAQGYDDALQRIMHWVSVS